MTINSFASCRSIKVFSATKARDRNNLGETVTDWVRLNRANVSNVEVLQSSDNEFHCLTIVLFLK